MLDIFREGAKTWISRVFIWGVALTFVGAAFVVWGQKGSMGTLAAANVGDVEISRMDIYKRTQLIESNLRQQLGQQYNADFLQSFNPKDMALNALIEEALMKKAAGEAGLFVSEEETRENIMGMDEFQTDGVFDRRKYLDILQLNGYKPGDFEASIRDGILISKFKSLALSFVRVSDAEVLDAYMKENQEVVADYVMVENADMMKEVKPEDPELEEWFNQRQLEFEVPAKRKFRILLSLPAYFELTVAANEDEMKKYFEDHIDEFKPEKTVEASHILAAVTLGAPAEIDNEAKEKVEKALARIEAGEGFAEVAKEVSEDKVTAPNGGSLGRFGKGKMLPAFEEVAFGLEPGQVSKPFKTNFGWHIVKVTTKHTGDKADFDRVKDLVRIQLKKEKSKTEAKAAIQQAQEKATLENFSQLEEVNKGLRFNSLSLGRNDMFPDVQDSEIIMNEIFSMKQGEVSRIVEYPEGYALIALDEVVEAHTPEFKDARGRAMSKYLDENARKAAREKVEKLGQVVKEEGKTLAQAAESMGMSAATTEPFSQARLRQDKELVDDGMVMEAFTLNPGETKVVSTLKGHVLIQLKERKKVDMEQVASNIKLLKNQALASKRERVLVKVVDALRKKAEAGGEIIIHDSMAN